MLMTKYPELFLSSVLVKCDDDVHWLFALPPYETPSVTLQEHQGAPDDGEAARLLPTRQDFAGTKEQHDLVWP